MGEQILQFKVAVDATGAMAAFGNLSRALSTLSGQTLAPGMASSATATAGLGRSMEGTAQAAKGMEASLANIQQALGGFGPNVLKVAGALTGATIGLMALDKAMRYVMDSFGRGSELLSLSRTTDQTVADLVTMQKALTNAGLSGESLRMYLMMLDRSVSASKTGAGGAAKAFAQMGLSIRDIEKMSARERLAAIADGLQNIRTQADKTRAMRDIFGRSGPQLQAALKDPEFVAKLKGGNGAYAELMERNAKLFDSINNGLAALGGRFKEAGATIAAAIGPMLDQMLSAFKGWDGAEAAKKFAVIADALKMVISYINTGIGALKYIIDVFSRHAAIVSVVTKALLAMGVAMASLGISKMLQGIAAKTVALVKSALTIKAETEALNQNTAAQAANAAARTKSNAALAFGSAKAGSGSAFSRGLEGGAAGLTGRDLAVGNPTGSFKRLSEAGYAYKKGVIVSGPSGEAAKLGEGMAQIGTGASVSALEKMGLATKSARQSFMGMTVGIREGEGALGGFSKESLIAKANLTLMIGAMASTVIMQWIASLEDSTAQLKTMEKRVDEIRDSIKEMPKIETVEQRDTYLKERASQIKELTERMKEAEEAKQKLVDQFFLPSVERRDDVTDENVEQKRRTNMSIGFGGRSTIFKGDDGKYYEGSAAQGGEAQFRAVENRIKEAQRGIDALNESRLKLLLTPKAGLAGGGGYKDIIDLQKVLTSNADNINEIFKPENAAKLQQKIAKLAEDLSKITDEKYKLFIELSGDPGEKLNLLREQTKNTIKQFNKDFQQITPVDEAARKKSLIEQYKNESKNNIEIQGDANKLAVEQLKKRLETAPESKKAEIQDRIDKLEELGRTESPEKLADEQLKVEAKTRQMMAGQGVSENMAATKENAKMLMAEAEAAANKAKQMKSVMDATEDKNSISPDDVIQYKALLVIAGKYKTLSEQITGQAKLTAQQELALSEAAGKALDRKRELAILQAKAIDNVALEMQLNEEKDFQKAKLGYEKEAAENPYNAENAQGLRSQISDLEGNANRTPEQDEQLDRLRKQLAAEEDKTASLKGIRNLQEQQKTIDSYAGAEFGAGNVADAEKMIVELARLNGKKAEGVELTKEEAQRAEELKALIFGLQKAGGTRVNLAGKSSDLAAQITDSQQRTATPRAANDVAKKRVAAEAEGERAKEKTANEIAVLEARASGNFDEATRLENAQKIKDLTREYTTLLMKANGSLTEEQAKTQALAMAQRRVNSEKAEQLATMLKQSKVEALRGQGQEGDAAALEFSMQVDQRSKELSGAGFIGLSEGEQSTKGALEEKEGVTGQYFQLNDKAIMADKAKSAALGTGNMDEALKQQAIYDEISVQLGKIADSGKIITHDEEVQLAALRAKSAELLKQQAIADVLAKTAAQARKDDQQLALLQAKVKGDNKGANALERQMRVEDKVQKLNQAGFQQRFAEQIKADNPKMSEKDVQKQAADEVEARAKYEDDLEQKLKRKATRLPSDQYRQIGGTLDGMRQGAGRAGTKTGGIERIGAAGDGSVRKLGQAGSGPDFVGMGDTGRGDFRMPNMTSGFSKRAAAAVQGPVAVRSREQLIQEQMLKHQARIARNTEKDQKRPPPG